MIRREPQPLLLPSLGQRRLVSLGSAVLEKGLIYEC
jgi:hypothetical protein